MTYVLRLKRSERSYGLVTARFICGWCGDSFLFARELVAHVCERRQAG